MDFPRRALLPQGSPRRSRKATRPGAMEADENVSPNHSVAASAVSPQRKKVLGGRNNGGAREAVSPAAPQPKPAPSPPSLTGRSAGTYDPKTNYTTPRPDFLRYNPERSREILLRLEREVEVESSSATSGTAASEAVSSGSSARGSDSECNELDDGDEEEVVVPVHRGGWTRRLFLLLVPVACSFFYIYCMTSPPLPASSEERLNLVGPNGSMYDAAVHQVDYLLGPNSIDMMGSEDVLEEATGQIVHGDSENVVYLYGPGGSPRNLMAISMMGMADVCPNVPLGEFTCQVGDENSENADDQKEGCDLGEQKTDMEEKSGLAHQEEGVGYSLQVSLEEVLEPGSEELHDGKRLGSEKLDQETEPWEYDSTAEAAKAISAMVKFLWSAMKPHLLHIWACLSVAGFVAAMFKYFQRSRKVPAPVSQHTPSAPPAQMPVLTPHQVAQLPVFPSPQSVQLPMFPSQQSVQLTVPKQEPSVSLELPVHLPLPKPDPFVNFKVPVIDHGNRDQRIRQGDADNMRASDSNTMDRKEIDSLKPPVVELLGEFLFVDAGSSRGRSIKDLNRHGGESGDVTVQESSVSSRKDVVKMQKESSKIQSPSVPRVRKEENAAKVEKMDATPTPSRRSSRLRNRVTSP